MRTPTDHWLEITIETRGAQGRGMAQGALQGNIVGEMRLNLLSLFFFSLSPPPPSLSPHNLSFSIFFLFGRYDEAFRDACHLVVARPLIRICGFA